MNDRSVFHLIAELTEKEGISCVLVGGFAINYYKVSRQTGDIDFLIIEEHYQKIKNSLKEAGYKDYLSTENFVRLKNSKLSLMDLDFIFVDADTLQKILMDSQEIRIAGQKLYVPSLDHLIALKLHAIKSNRKNRLIKDLPDIINLISVNKIDINNPEFKELCLKYGTEDIYQRIVETLQ